MDTQFLRDLGLMDYSLLFVVEHVKVNDHSPRTGPVISEDPSIFGSAVSMTMEDEEEECMENFHKNSKDRHRLFGTIKNMSSIRGLTKHSLPFSKTLKAGKTMGQLGMVQPVYHIGVIDYLQNWSIKKRGERFLKSMFKDSSFQHNISAVPPKPYQARFTQFMTSAIFKPGLESKAAQFC
mmetsp:Transcript_29302/g.44134  ORF Transcript_29302/g.44134 Transcript_29302/m.44134 type:complete len:180 (-) Transcript_29302:99-638(-)